MKAILRLFKPLSITQLLVRELEEAQRNKLEAESGKEYAASIVAYNDARIKRLTARLEATFEGEQNA